MTAGKIGEFARSKAGHDKDDIFIIFNIEGEYVYLVDGKSRSIEKPKKKKWKHIQPIHRADSGLQKKLEGHCPIQNEEIRRAIKDYQKEIESGTTISGG